MKTKLLIVTCIIYSMLMTSYAQSIAGGGGHSIFLCSDSTVKTTGFNNYGELGNNTTTSSLVPVQVVNLAGVSKVAAKEHSLFLKSDGTVWSCGFNSAGQLGDGTTIDRSSPVQVNNLNGVTAISACFQSLFLKSDSTVWACGSNNFGALGDGTTTSSQTPIQVNNLSGIIAIATGVNFSLFLKSDGTVWGCGFNASGQLGDGTTTNRYTPVQVNNLTNIIAIAAGYEHSLFVKNDGTVWSCGRNGAGQLGQGATDYFAHPNVAQIIGLSNITAISGGSSHSLFLDNNGSVKACGFNDYGQLGDGTTTLRSSPVSVITPGIITAISAGQFHSFLLTDNGSAWACGWNYYGQLGTGTTSQETIPVQIPNLCTIAIPTSTKEKTMENTIDVYPNPNNGLFQIKTNEILNTINIRVTDIVGRDVYNSVIKQFIDGFIDISNQPDGVYFLEVQTGTKLFTRKIIVNK